MSDSYFKRRLREELRLADQAESLLERAVRLEVCRRYRDLLFLAELVPAPRRRRKRLP